MVGALSGGGCFALNFLISVATDMQSSSPARFIALAFLRRAAFLSLLGVVIVAGSWAMSGRKSLSLTVIGTWMRWGMARASAKDTFTPLTA